MSDVLSGINFNLHPKQTLAFCSTANELLYGGATRGGKSFFTRAALTVWSDLIPGLQSFIYRKYYDDVIANHMESEDGFRATLSDAEKAGLIRITENKVKWLETGSMITLGHLASDEAAEKGRGVPKHVLVFEEAPQLLERHMRFLRAWVSMPEGMRDKLPDQLRPLYGNIMTDEEMRNLFPRTIYTGNPKGPSMPYFRRHFVLKAPMGEIFKASKSEGGQRRQYIEARVEDNPSEDAALVHARVHGLGDEAEADALLNANWNAPFGDFLPQYDDNIHKTPDLVPPEHWFKFISFDWGSAEPFAVLWWCVSDGEIFHDENECERWFYRTSLICYREWYGALAGDPSRGLEMTNEKVAEGIKERTKEATSGLILSDPVPFRDLGYTNQNKEKYKIADVFRDCGVPLTQGNSARIYGWNQLKSRLRGVILDPNIPPVPLIHFCESCVHTREYLPALTRHKTNKEDAQEKGEATHCCDAVRIACATKLTARDKQNEGSKGFSKPARLTPRSILNQLRAQSNGERHFSRY